MKRTFEEVSMNCGQDALHGTLRKLVKLLLSFYLPRQCKVHSPDCIWNLQGCNPLMDRDIECFPFKRWIPSSVRNAGPKRSLCARAHQSSQEKEIFPDARHSQTKTETYPPLHIARFHSAIVARPGERSPQRAKQRDRRAPRVVSPRNGVLHARSRVRIPSEH